MASKIRIESELYERAKAHAEGAGYSSVEEFVTHLIERELAEEGPSGDDQDEAKKRLKGLGYIS